jgi:hypothetical protein
MAPNIVRGVFRSAAIPSIFIFLLFGWLHGDVKEQYEIY